MSETSENRVVLITGASGALGSELSRLCALASWQTVLTDKSRFSLEKLYDAIVQAGGLEPALFEMDLETLGPHQCQEMTTALESQFGRLDAVVHCAARFSGLQPLDLIEPQEWLRLMQVNLNAPWLLSIGCLPLLRLAADASLYFISEDLHKVAGAYWGAYGVSKHGLKALASQFESELRNTGVQVLTINPGPMRSPLRANAYHTENPGEIPSPLLAARKILDLLERRENAGASHLDLDIDPV